MTYAVNAEGLLLEPERCARCGRQQGLYVVTNRGRMCGPCWNDSGQPGPPPPTAEELERVELQWAGVKTGKGSTGERVTA